MNMVLDFFKSYRMKNLSAAKPKPHRTQLGVEEVESRLVQTTLPAGFTETNVVTGLAVGDPLYGNGGVMTMEFAPGERLFVLEQAGNVKLVHNDGTTFTALTLNVDSTNERGLLGIAFDPNYSTNHF